MSYYSDERIPFIVSGQHTMLTEDEAERLEMAGEDVVPVFEVGDGLPDEAADEYLEHTCGQELPDGRSIGTCKLCELIFEENFE